jgi:hypothetical protein
MGNMSISKIVKRGTPPFSSPLLFAGHARAHAAKAHVPLQAYPFPDHILPSEIFQTFPKRFGINLDPFGAFHIWVQIYVGMPGTTFRSMIVVEQLITTTIPTYNMKVLVV